MLNNISQTYELFSIQTDKSTEYTVEKVIMNQGGCQEFFSLFEKFEEVEVTGLYGSQYEIMKTISMNFNGGDFSSVQAENGKILGMRNNNQMIFALVFPEIFFLSKPLDEKSIKITLLRIMFDLTKNIKLCFDKEVFNKWYNKEFIPFSNVNIMNSQEYLLDSSKNREIMEKYLSLDVAGNQLNQLKFSCQNKGGSAIFSQVHEISEKEIKSEFNKQYKFTVAAILEKMKYNQEISVENEVNSYSLFLIDSLSDLDKDSQIKREDNLYKTITGFINELKTVRNDNKMADKLIENYKKQFYDQLMLQEKVYFKIQRSAFKFKRQSSNLDDQISSVHLEIENTCSIQRLEFTKYQNGLLDKLTNLFTQRQEKAIPKFEISFRTIDDHQVFIFQDTIKKQHLIYILPLSQKKWIQLQSIQKTHDFCIFYFNEKNNSLYVFNAQDNKVVYKFEFQGKQLISYIFCEQSHQISAVAFLQLTQKFIILTQDKQLLVLEERDRKFKIQSLDTRQNQNINSKTFNQLLPCPSGKYFYLTNDSKCYMFDCNFALIKQFQIQGIGQKLQVISEKSDVFILNYESKQITVLTNVIDKSQLTKVNHDEIKIEGNPSIDIINGAILKFGSVSSFLTNEKQNKVYLYANESEQGDLVQNYLNQLTLQEFEIQCSKSLVFSTVSLMKLQGNFYSRVPLQLCTIENGNFIPLIDGFRKEIKKNKYFTIEEKTKQLHFGHLENYLVNLKENIFVVSIIGKQSSGKSYLLNRIFGTRYSVAASRCTDGVWASFARVENQNFLIFDCEGLFSSARNQKEEVQMLAFLTALSDVTILNQDLTFNRFLEDLLDKLSEASEQLVGDLLFKGFLTIVLRDVSIKDNKGIDEELINNINKQKQGERQEIVYLKNLFNNKLVVQQLVNFETKMFDKQIQTLRIKFIQQSKNCKRWEDGEQLIQQIKILLCQLETSDKTNSTFIQQQMKIRQIIQQKKQQWMQFLLNINKSSEYQKQHQKDFEDPNNDLKLEDFSYPKVRNHLNQLFREMVQRKFGLILQTTKHNENLKIIDQEIQKIMNENAQYLLNQISQEFLKLSKVKEIQEFQISEKADFNEFLSRQILQYKFCMQKCSVCFLNCQNFSIHDSEQKMQLNELTVKISNLENAIREIDKQFEKQKISQNIVLQQQVKSENLQKIIDDLEQEQKQTEFQMQLFLENEKLIIITQAKKRYFTDHLYQLQNFLIKECENVDDQDQMSIEEANLQQLNQIRNINLADRAKIEIEIDKSQQILEKHKIQFFDFQAEEEKMQKNESSLNLQTNVLVQQIDLLNQQILQKQNLLDQQNNTKTDSQQLIQSEYGDNGQLEEQLQFINLKIQENEKETKLWKDQSERFLKAEQFLVEFEEKNSNLEQISQQIDDLNQKKINFGFQSRKLPKESNEYKQLKEQIAKIDIQVSQLEDQYDEQKSPQIEKILELKAKQGISNQEIYEGFLQMNLDKEKQFQNKQHELVQNQLNLQKIIYEHRKQLENIEEKKIIENLKNQLQQIKQRLKKIRKDLNNLQQELKNKRLEKEKIKFLLQNQQNAILLDSQALEKIIKILQQLDIAIEKYPQYIELTKQYQENVQRQTKLREQALQEDYPSTKSETCSNIKQFQIKIQNLQNEIQLRQTERNQLQNTIYVFRKNQEQHLELVNLKNQQKIIEKNKNDHSCLRIDHQCDEFCICCRGVACKFLAGHTGEHLCKKPDHSCDEQCQVPECSHKCSFVRNHSNQHFCQNFHACKQICQHCVKQCEIDCQQNHNQHFCKEPKCIRKCFLCDLVCDQKHDHSKQPEQNHFCKNQHNCYQLCESQGRCMLIYQELTNEWKSPESNFEYKYYKQIDAGKQKCKLKIPQNQINHEGDHVCVNKHYCKQRCPECDAFCIGDFNHTDVHSTHQHRNKEKQYFTLSVGRVENIRIDESKIYKVGDSSKPETCKESCERRGRSHFHLMECQGGNKCLEKNAEYQKYARHAKDKYQGFEHLNFDEVLCCHFWKIQKWSHPNSANQEDIAKCNHYCSQCGDKGKKFCVEMAWHTNSNKRTDHEFICQEFHLKNQLKGLQICFVIDSTGSMDRYLEQSIDVIKQIMEKSKDFKIDGKRIPIEFSIVSYKDHPVPYKSTQVVQIKDFTNDENCSKFLEGIKAEGGEDIPEALLDGLQAALQLQWNFTYQRVLYLIADAPPHGKNKEKTIVYHNIYDDNYPDGCPCGLQQQPILNEMKRMNIKFKILQVNNRLELTIQEFQQYYKELELLDIKNNPASFIDVVVQDACSVMKQNEITYDKNI